MRILRILSGALLAAAVALTVTATPAAAHVALVESSPEDGAKLDTTPEKVELTFSEVLDAPSTKVAVTDAAGDTVDQAAPRIEDKTITLPLRLPREGQYTVSYRIVSEDGHPVEDSISFFVASVPEADRSEAGSEASETDAGHDGSDGAKDGDSGIGWGTVAAVAGGLAVIVAVVVLLVRRRSRVS